MKPIAAKAEPHFPVKNTLGQSCGSNGRGHYSRLSAFQGSTRRQPRSGIRLGDRQVRSLGKVKDSCLAPLGLSTEEYGKFHLSDLETRSFQLRRNKEERGNGKKESVKQETPCKSTSRAQNTPILIDFS